MSHLWLTAKRSGRLRCVRCGCYRVVHLEDKALGSLFAIDCPGWTR